ncbi:hypothetical protein [Rhodococcus tukisamuensis]|uniref:hypothetical protein n=1 Tax=Rhodococcus tukisamuensis TaxID=168276 RepID=UPI000933A141|nr:hypothetical protein [Rhodococcus tukisamuensis]
MLEPSGPLPPEIYWRRRMLAIGVSVVVLLLLVWIISAVSGGDEDPSAEAVASSSALAASSSASAAASSSTTETDDADDADSGGQASGSAVSGSAAASAAEVAGTLPPGQCADKSLAIKASSDAANYPAGQDPAFGIVITNIGNESCERDLGAGMQQVMVYSLDGQHRLWSNTDCFPNNTPDVRTLKPGEQAAFTIKWSGATSEPGCAAARNPVGPGAYTVVGQLGALRSTPEPFNIS